MMLKVSVNFEQYRASFFLYGTEALTYIFIVFTVQYIKCSLLRLLAAHLQVCVPTMTHIGEWFWIQVPRNIPLCHPKIYLTRCWYLPCMLLSFTFFLYFFLLLLMEVKAWVIVYTSPGKAFSILNCIIRLCINLIYFIQLSFYQIIYVK